MTGFLCAPGRKPRISPIFQGGIEDSPLKNRGYQNLFFEEQEFWTG
jgi:hypothetical protein